MINLEQAQLSANKCSGENAPKLALLSYDNVIEIRKDFLLNAAYNGSRTHRDIINVLEYMDLFIEVSDEELSAFESNQELER